MDTDEHGWGRETRIARIFTNWAGNLTARNMKKSEGYITEANEGSEGKTSDR